MKSKTKGGRLGWIKAEYHMMQHTVLSIFLPIIVIDKNCYQTVWFNDNNGKHQAILHCCLLDCCSEPVWEKP